MANILVVDDAKVMRFYISKLLKELGHTVIAEAKDGFEALEAYKEYKPDLVTMDIEMPVSHAIISGVHAVEEIINFDSSAAIIMISILSDDNHVAKALKSGAKGYIGKPITKEKLQKVMTDLNL